VALEKFSIDEMDMKFTIVIAGGITQYSSSTYYFLLVFFCDVTVSMFWRRSKVLSLNYENIKG